MEFDYKIILAAIAIIILIAIVLNPQGAINPEQGDPTVMLKEKQELTLPPLTLEYWPEGNQEKLLITAEGDTAFNLFTVVPFDRASSYSDYEIDNAPPSPAENIFAEDALATRDSIALAANETKNKTLSFDSNGSAPLYLVTQPGAAAKEAEAFAGLLKEIASLSLGRSESNALQSKLNEFLSPEEEITAELIEAVSEAVEEVKQAKITNPDYNATKQIEELKLPEYAPPIEFQNATEILEEALSELPDELEFEVSEFDPHDTKYLGIPISPEEGYLLFQTEYEGNDKKYFEEDYEEVPGFEYVFELSANVEDEIEDGILPFDEAEAVMKLTIGSTKLITQIEKEIKLKITVEHILPEFTAPDNGKAVEVPEESVIDFESQTRLFNCPVTGAFTGAFGDPRDGGARLHHGIDIAVPEGTPILAPANGIVRRIISWTPDDGCGNGLIIDHEFSDGSHFNTLYCHLNTVNGVLHEGSVIRVDDTLGMVGKTGCTYPNGCDGAHLHFEVRLGTENNPVDPVSYVGYCDQTKEDPWLIGSGQACSKLIQDTPSNFASCAQFEQLLEQYMHSNGLYDLGVDLGLVEALIKIESNCNPDLDYIGGYGLMQVMECGPSHGGCTLEENIDLGTQELANRITNAHSRGLTGVDAIALAFFGYNRGEGAMYRAINNHNAGMSWNEAMVESCQHYYDTYSGCAGFDRNACCGVPGTHDGDYHSGTGLGARYPEKILTQYYTACVASSGQPITWE